MTPNANLLADQAKNRDYLNVMQALLWLIFFLPFYLFAGLRLVLSARAIPDGLLMLSYISWTLFTPIQGSNPRSFLVIIF
ncbi:MAG: hypothetical protein ACPGWR_24555 [Ardenticatenaceae bacterium]